jgi:LacI family transcriptional regulator
MSGIKDVAEKSGVSISTVSNVLNGKKNVGERTRERVLSICQELNYYPNSAGRALKSGKSNVILFNFGDFDRSFYLKIIQGISDCVNDYEYDLAIITEKSCEKFMRNNMSAGSIILDEKIPDTLLESVANIKYPIVVMDRKIDNPHIKSVIIDNYTPMKKMVQGLVDKGYKKFAFIAGPEHTLDNIERYKAFKDVLEINNIVFSQNDYYAGNYREKSGYLAAKIFIISQDVPEVFVCANDNMAIGAIKALEENGYRVPEDVAITGFDNIQLAEAMDITTVDIPKYERGFIAAKYLIEYIKGKTNVDDISIEAKVVWRNSTPNK